MMEVLRGEWNEHTIGISGCGGCGEDLQREYRMENSGAERHVRGDLRVVAMLSVTCQTRMPLKDNIVVYWSAYKIHRSI